MKIDIQHIAKLANLQVSESETALYEKQLSAVLDYINKLNEVDLSAEKAGVTGVEPTSQVTGLENVSRKDEAHASLTQAEALSGAKGSHNGLFVVKGIFQEE